MAYINGRDKKESFKIIYNHFLEFDPDTQKIILDYMTNHLVNIGVNIKYDTDILDVTNYIYYMELFTNYDLILENFTDEELKELQTIICEKAIKYSKSTGLNQIYFPDCYIHLDMLIDDMADIHSKKHTIYYSGDEEYTRFDLEKFFNDIEDDKIQNNSAYFEDFIEEFVEHYYYEVLTSKYIDIDKRCGDIQYLVDEYTKLLNKILSPKAKYYLNSLNKTNRYKLIMHLPFFTKEELDRSLENRKEYQELLKSDRLRKEDALQRKKEKISKVKYPKIKERKKQ